jgi:hypothetical protein
MSAAAPQGFANLPAPLGAGSADPGGAQIFAFGGVLWMQDSQGNLWALNQPRGDWLPGDAGLLEFNFDPAAASATGTILVSNKVALARINVRTPTVVNNVIFHVNTVAASLTANQNFAGIYSSAGTLLGSSAAGSLDSKVTSTGVITQALSGPVSLGPGFYWVSLLFNGTTPPVVAVAANSALNANTGLTAAAYRFAANGTGTTLPASITPSSNTQTSASGAIPFWVGVS